MPRFKMTKRWVVVQILQDGTTSILPNDHRRGARIFRTKESAVQHAQNLNRLMDVYKARIRFEARNARKLAAEIMTMEITDD